MVAYILFKLKLSFQFRVLDKAVKCMQNSKTITIKGIVFGGFWVMDFQSGSSVMRLKLRAISDIYPSINRCQSNTGHLYPNTKIASKFIHCKLQAFYKPLR